MNIFFLDYHHATNAHYHCDRHVIKLILESAQMACTAHHLHSFSFGLPETLYKATHKNHPMNCWTRFTITNYVFCVKYGLALCNEYTYRFGKVHKTQTILEWLLKNFPNINTYGLTEPPQCMPDEYKKPGLTVEAYRNYYRFKKQTIQFKYTKRKEPSWI